jgi:hypothetical protein
MCDDRSCGIWLNGAALTQSAETMVKSQTEFMLRLKTEGWSVGLDAQFCPQCTAQMQAKAVDEQKRIQVVSGQVIKNGKLVQLK